MPSSQVHVLHASSGDYTCAPPPPTKKSSDDHCCFENTLCASYVCGASILDNSQVQTYAESNTTWCNIIAASADISYTSSYNSTCGGTAMNCIYAREYFASSAQRVYGELHLAGTIGLAWMLAATFMGWLGRTS
ncbi:hypothetical protein I316_03292 [Kwoniella heveanensis BCC8398]|uniref:Uncharacterized protein n=1 Tax=Kwoniella heveanensis BCC8398 TaxID=1296120 RepID=A0A1B9GUN0_9TREE|nr:hypothetical protein I316_03292 [Kwoniella heveanensis BCC8398]